MKIKNILKTVLLILLFLMLSRFNFKEMEGTLKLTGYVLFGLNILLLIGFYVFIRYKKSAKKLLVPALIGLLLCPFSAQAFEFGDGIMDLDYVKPIENTSDLGAYASDVCGGRDTGTIDVTILRKATAILDYYNKNGGGPASGGIFSSSGAGYDCATEYIDYAGELQKASGAKCDPTTAILKGIATRNKCWPCDVTSVIIGGIQNMVLASYNVINNGAKMLLGLIYLFWLAITILISFAKFGFEKFAEFFTKLLNQTIVVLIVAAILHAPLVQFYRATVSPFITYSAGLAMEFSEIGSKNMGDGLFNTIIKTLGISASSKCSYCNSMKTAINSEVSTGQFMDSASVRGILCITCSTYRQLAPMVSLGQVMICLGRSTPELFSAVPFLNQVAQFSTPNISLTLMGYLLVILFSVLMFLVGYFIMAAVFRLGLVLVLMPLFLVAFAFKVSRPYATRAWGVIVYAMGTILIVSLTCTMLMMGFTALLPDSTIGGFVDLFFSSNPSMVTNIMGGMDMTSFANMTENDLMEYASSAGDMSAAIRAITMAAYCYICIHVISASTEIAEQITNAWQINSKDGQILTQAMTEATGAGVKASQATFAAGGYMTSKVFRSKGKDGKYQKGKTDKVDAKGNPLVTGQEFMDEAQKVREATRTRETHGV